MPTKKTSYSTIAVLLTAALLWHGTAMADAASAAINNDSYLKTVNFNDYISSKNYAPVSINNSYGQLVTESQIGIYKSAALQDFYKDLVCKGMWGKDCDFTISSIQKYTGIDLNQESSLVGQNYSQINAYKVIYTTQGMDGQAHNVSGAVLVPQSDQALKGVVIFYHFTVLNKTNVPSNFEGDQFHVSKITASALASDGYVVVMPDYLGEGIDQDAVHPYMLYPQINALSGIYMLKLLSQIQPGLKYQTVNNQTPLYLSGYSEGAGYTLWAAKILQDNKPYLDNLGFKLAKTVPMDGAYNLSNVTLPFLQSNIANSEKAPYYIQDKRVAAFSKPGLVANVLYSYAHFNLNNDESAVFSTAFNSCSDCSADGQSYNIGSLLQSPVSEINKYKMLYKAAEATGYSNDNVSLAPLTNQQLLRSEPFKNALVAADIYNWRAITPISFLTLEYDSVVPRLNSETAYAAMAANGSTSLNITVVPNQNFKVDGYIPFTDDNVDHSQGLRFLLLFARNQFDESAPMINSSTH